MTEFRAADVVSVFNTFPQKNFLSNRTMRNTAARRFFIAMCDREFWTGGSVDLTFINLELEENASFRSSAAVTQDYSIIRIDVQILSGVVFASFWWREVVVGGSLPVTPSRHGRGGCSAPHVAVLNRKCASVTLSWRRREIYYGTTLATQPAAGKTGKRRWRWRRGR